MDTNVVIAIASVVLAGVVQLCVIAVWAGRISSRIQFVEDWIKMHGAIPERIVRLETTLHDIRNSLQEIKGYIKKVTKVGGDE
jgi:hypothetical protein